MEDQKPTESKWDLFYYPPFWDEGKKEEYPDPEAIVYVHATRMGKCPDIIFRDGFSDDKDWPWTKPMKLHEYLSLAEDEGWISAGCWGFRKGSN